jgi:hypothetical protein
MEKNINLINDECEYTLNAKLVAINEEKKMELFEDESGIENNGCNTHQLKAFFPEFDFDFYKEYFVKINDVFFNGDTLDDYINQNME